MQFRVQVLLLVITTTFMASCGLLPERRVRSHELSSAKFSIASFSASQRGAYFRHDDSAATYCAEPFPDVALDSVVKLAGKLSAKEIGEAEASADLSAKVVELAGRTQLVLLAREMLYRTCELSANKLISGEEAKAQFDSIIVLIQTLGLADLAKATGEVDPELQRQLLENAGDALDRS